MCVLAMINLGQNANLQMMMVISISIRYSHVGEPFPCFYSRGKKLTYVFDMCIYMNGTVLLIVIMTLWKIF